MWQRRFDPMLREYERITGFRETEHHAVFHHKVSFVWPTLFQLWQAASQPEREILCGVRGDAHKMMPDRFPCVCCGYLTMDRKPGGTFDFCPVCFWEDDPAQFDDHNSKAAPTSCVAIVK